MGRRLTENTNEETSGGAGNAIYYDRSGTLVSEMNINELKKTLQEEGPSTLQHELSKVRGQMMH